MRKPLLKLSALALVIGLAACQHDQPNSVIIAPQVPVNPPKTLPINTRKVEWKVLTQAELVKLLDELEKNPDPNFALFALTPQGFENLSYNLLEIKRFIQEQQEVIVYYQQIIDQPQAEAGKASK